MNITPDIINDLEATFSDVVHEFAQYILEASPYTRPEDEDTVTMLKKVAAEGNSVAAYVGHILREFEAIPEPGPPDRITAEIAYLDIRHLIRLYRRRLKVKIKYTEIRCLRAEGIPRAKAAQTKALAFLKKALLAVSEE